MAQTVPSRVFALLADMAEPLMRTALLEAPPLTHADPEASAEDLQRSQHVVGASLAIQAILRTESGMQMSEFEIMMALAAVCGTILAQCEDRKTLYQAFNAQFAAVLKEVGEAHRAGMQ